MASVGSPLYRYLAQVQRLIGYDEHQGLYNIDDLAEFVNIARGEVAAQGQCIRRKTPSSGAIYQLNVVAPGVGYSNPLVTISAPDAPSGSLPYPLGAQATATVQQIGGQISGGFINFGGAGYFQPTATIIDPTGTGAIVQPVVVPINQTMYGQEEYPFSGVSMAPFPGVGQILAVRSVTFTWGNEQWSLTNVSFSRYQAQIRRYTSSFFAPPGVCCQFGQGTEGTLLLYPFPDQSYQMVWDTTCLPLDLIDDTSFEAIPPPFDKAVPYYAAHLALLSRAAEVPQMLPLANTYFNEKTGGLFGAHMRRARAFSQPGQVSSFYGRV